MNTTIILSMLAGSVITLVTVFVFRLVMDKIFEKRIERELADEENIKQIQESFKKSLEEQRQSTL